MGGASQRGGGRQPGVNPGSTSDLLSPSTGDSPFVSVSLTLSGSER